jgi:HK97 family phage prohead protease
VELQRLNCSLEIKALNSREFEGYGSVFKNVDLGGDIVVPGAFRGTLKEHKSAGTLPQMFWMHQPDQVPGKWIEMHEDDKGLFVKGVLAETQLGEEMHTLLNMKAVRGMSIGYRLPRKYDAAGRRLDVDWDEDGNRLLKEIDLPEVSLVSLAMNPLARVTASKSRLSHYGEYVPTERELESRLRDAGFSRRVAQMLIKSIHDEGISGGSPDSDFLRDSGNVDDDTAELLEAARKAGEALAEDSILDLERSVLRLSEKFRK